MGRIRSSANGEAMVHLAVPGLGVARLWITVSGWCDQASTGTWRMSWRQEAMKDVVTCDKPEGAGNRL